ncbi:MAG: family efflux transporter, subunit [Actinomycetota bacterium]|nr:family efflux transporter, subunit [Actinomycetota bacterium]
MIQDRTGSRGHDSPFDSGLFRSRRWGRSVALYGSQGIVLILGLIGIAWAFGWLSGDGESGPSSSSGASTAVSVTTAKVVQGTVGGATLLEGTAQSPDPRQVMPEVPGKLVTLSVKQGSKVRAGQVIATLKDSGGILTSALATARTAEAEAISGLDTLQHPLVPAVQLASIRASVETAQQAAEDARKTRDRAEEDYKRAKERYEQDKDRVKEKASKSGGTSTAVIDSVTAANVTAAKSRRDAARDAAVAADGKASAAERELESYEHLNPAPQTQIDAARIKLTAAKAQVRVATSNLTALTIKAPVAGTVTEAPQTVGAMVTTGTVLVRIDSGLTEVKASADAGTVVVLGNHPSTTATATIQGMSPARAVLSRVAPLTRASSDRTDVMFSLPAAVRLRPGTKVTLSVKLPTATGLSVPTAAVTNDGTATVVYVVENRPGDPKDPPTVVRRVPVTLGSAGSSRALVSGQGLSEGDTVVTTGQTQLTDGARIRVLGSDGTSSPEVTP